MFERFFTREQPVEQQRGLMSRMLSIRSDTVDEKARSVEALLSTEGQVTVRDPVSRRMIDEVLISRGAELPTQIPLLADHKSRSIDNVLGSVRNMRVTEDGIVGRLFFAGGNERADAAWNMVQQGHHDTVSVGYEETGYKDIPSRRSAEINGRRYTAGDLLLRITQKWQPRELSLVPIGADPRTKIREEADALASGQHERTISMDPKLRKYLESLGLRADATDEEAEGYMAGLGGNQRSICNVLNHPADDDTARDMQRLSLEGLGVCAEEPWVPVDAGQVLPTRVHPASEVAREVVRATAAAPLASPTDASAAVRADRERQTAIREMVGDDADDAFIRRAIDDDWDVGRTAAALLPVIRDKHAPAVGGIHSRNHDTDCNVRSLSAGLLFSQGLDPTKHSLHRGEHTPERADQLSEQDADLGERVSRMHAVDLCRECVRLDGGRVTHDREGMVRAAVSGTSLASVFTTNVYARLMAAWETVGDTTNGWVDEEDVPNFLTQEEIQLEADTQLERLASGDTAKHATASDKSETYKIARYAKQFVVDEQTIIDDRLGAIMRMPEEMGKKARKLRPELVYAIMLENPTMTDTGAVFNATAVTTAGGHANLTTGVLGAEALREAITAMVIQRIGRTLTEPGDSLNIRPNFLIVPPDLEWTARALLSSGNLVKLFADTADPLFAPINLIAQEGITLVIDSRIDAIGVKDPKTKTVRTGTATNWWLAAGGDRGLKVAYRSGTNRAPSARSFVLTQGQWGIGWDINMDIGAAFTEYRTWHKSTGAG